MPPLVILKSIKMRCTVVLIFTFLVRNGYGLTDPVICYEQITSTLAASNTINGAQLTYKQSVSTSSSVLFDGLNISSSEVCGESYERCSIFHLAHEDILLAALPLGRYIGMVTFNTSEDQLTFLQQYNIEISTSLSCEISTIFLFTPFSEDLSVPTLLAVCQGVSTVELLTVTLIPTEARSLTPRYLPQCSVTRPSEFVFFESVNLFDGVVVFVNESGVLLQRTVESEECMAYEYPGVCSDVERFAAIPDTDGLQVIYCSTQTIVLDITMNAVSGTDSGVVTLSRSEDGLPMFCSRDIYCSYRGNNFTLLRRVDEERTTVLGNPVEVMYEDEVMWGDCVAIDDQYYAVVQLRNKSVAAVLLDQGIVLDLGVSLFPPRVFEQSVVLIGSTRTAIFSLLDRKFSDAFDGSFVLGSVVNGDRIPVPCPATSTDVMLTDAMSTDVTFTDVTTTNVTTEPSSAFLGYIIGIPVAALAILLFAVLVLVVLIIVCVIRKSRSRIHQPVELEINGIISGSNELKDHTPDSTDVTITVTTATSSTATATTTATTATTATSATTTATATSSTATATTTATTATTATSATTAATTTATATATATTAMPSNGATTPTHDAATLPTHDATTLPTHVTATPVPDARDAATATAAAAAQVVVLGNHHQNQAPYTSFAVNTQPFQEHSRHVSADSTGDDDDDDDGGERQDGGGDGGGGGGGGERQDGGGNNSDGGGGGGERGGGGGGRRYRDNNNKWKYY